ncbi:hypothetical protein SELMODRAFT_78126 [Selaginella moellendorffii]|uniref:Pentacotripeptide-repeat region of PRORP domain-containing protein n=1 Tax=Selaginella moellendorffii TaxID=88036 RepID=D8QUH2_SELML|nr:hypothetical protein SELMODRAFT_78126 [Selaginella moellendorffii]
MIQAYVDAGRLEEARAIMDRSMPATNEFIEPWTVLMVGYARAGQAEEAREVFARMPGKNAAAWTVMLATQISWNTMLAGYGVHHGKLLEAQEIFYTMPARSIVSWNSLLGSVTGNGNLEAAARFFERFPEKNVVSYNTMIAGNAQAGELSSCFNLVAKMAIEGLTLDEQSFSSVLAASSHGGKLEQGLRHFVLMSGDFGITALREHYDSVTDILGRAGNLELAREVVQAMPFLPDLLAWGSLLGGYQMQSGQGFTQRAARSVFELGLGRANNHTKW